MIRLYLGRKEQGKTTLAYHMAAKLPRRLVFDSRGLIRRPGAAVARTMDGLEKGVGALADGEIAEVVYTPRDPLKTIAFPEFATQVRGWVDMTPDLELAVFVDELTFVNILDPDFEWAMKCCRADRMHFFLTCHRPADVPVDIRALADYWYLFAAHQEHDRAVIEERCSTAAALRVARLTDRQYVTWDDRHATLADGAAPGDWYVDLSPGGPVAAPLDLDSSTGSA